MDTFIDGLSKKKVAEFFNQLFYIASFFQVAIASSIELEIWPAKKKL